MMKRTKDFENRVGTEICLDESLIVEKQNRYFLLDKKLKELIWNNFFYGGIYLGKTKNGKFFPSFMLLSMIATKKKANKITVDEKTAWLFICGRDVFRKGVTKVMGSMKKGDYTLVLNEHGECLGFGKILRTLDKEKGEVAVKNISDIGDFLRREKLQDHGER